MLNSLYFDRAILVVSKPPGLLSVPGIGPDKQDSVASRAKRLFPASLIVHRLDCHTSGVMVLAMNKSCQVELSRQFHDREVTKTYIAMVEGEVCGLEGIIEQPLRCDITHRPRQIVNLEQGNFEKTAWRVSEIGNERNRLT